MVIPASLASAPYRLPTAVPVSLANRNGYSESRAQEARAVSGSALMAVNALDLEDYVRGVVSGESPSGWPVEALKANRLKEIRLELAYVASPFREETVNFVVSIGVGK